MGDYPSLELLSPLELLEESLRRLAAEDARALAGRDEIVRVHRAKASLEAVVARASAAFDAEGQWALDRARYAWSWLMVEAGLSKAAARRAVAQGRALRHLPLVEAAWLGGEITSDHVRVLSCARTPKTEDHMARDEALLVEKAKTLRFDVFKQALDYWSQ